MPKKITTKLEIRFGDDRDTATELLHHLDHRGLDNQLAITDYGFCVISRCSPSELHQYGAAVKELLG